MKPSYKKGEILNINLGKPLKEIKGHEEGYDRPCIVIKSFNNLGLAVIIPCTKSVPGYNIFSIVKLLKGSGGLTSDSYALCYQIRTVSFDRILNKRGKLDNKDILKIHSVLIDTLEL